MEKKSYYAIVPAKVRYHEKLKSREPLLYGEITALCNDKGYCWAANKYFSDLYNVSQRTIRRWIELLEKYRFIKVEIIGFKRKIYIVDDLNFEECDDDGNPKKIKQERKPRERKDQKAKKIQKWFASQCKKHLDAEPVTDVKGYYAVLRVMNKWGLTEMQIVDLLDEWFALGKSPEDTASILKALSNDQVTKYKVRHRIK